MAARPERKAAPPEQVADDEESQGAWLGITGIALSPDLAEALELPADQEGILVQQVERGSPAHSVGIKGGYMPLEFAGKQVLAGGDVILAIDGTALTDVETLQETLSQFEAGDEITLRLLREAEEIDVDVTLAEQTG